VRRFRFGVVAALVLGTFALGARAGEVRDLDDLLKKTKVPLGRAVEEALKAAPGQAVRARLVRGEDGAASWRVLVHRGAELTEVAVDGASGKAAVRDSWKDEPEAEKARPPRASDSD
jgi:hypothetical protein